MSEIILITGGVQAGKTTLCLGLYRFAREKGLQVGGVVSPAVFDGGSKTAIHVLDLKSGDQKLLAELKSNQRSDLETQRWSFSPEAVAWGNQRLLESVPCDLLIVDELGPLEFEREEGWVNAFTVIDSGFYSRAVIVIRPSLISQASQRWHAVRVIDLSDSEADPLADEGLFESLALGQG
jgi:nucleoside-triphosphatase THEP1